MDFFVRKTNSLNKITTGMGSLIFLVNSLPFGGYCNVDKYNGTSLSTVFNIRCHGWLDPDGHIEKYEYFGKKKRYNLKLILIA